MNWLRPIRPRMVIRVLISLIIVGAVSYAIHFFDNGWVGVLYTTVLALFTDEIKSLWNRLMDLLFPDRQVRVTCSYHFRIMNANYYLLIDEHNENLYRPVGGVYKYHKDFDVSTRFEGTYDGIRESIDDTENDLRLVISARKEKDFFKWFAANSDRETIQNLTREFREELIDTELIPSDHFVGQKLTYSYVGSYTKKSTNRLLNVHQSQYYDVVNILLSDAQQSAIKRLAKETPDQGKPSYIFATREEIIQGSCNRAMGIRKISPTAKYILVSGGPPLEKKDYLKRNYTPTMEKGGVSENQNSEATHPD